MILGVVVGWNSTNGAGGFNSSRPKIRSERSFFKSDNEVQAAKDKPAAKIPAITNRLRKSKLILPALPACFPYSAHIGYRTRSSSKPPDKPTWLLPASLVLPAHLP